MIHVVKAIYAGLNGGGEADVTQTVWGIRSDEGRRLVFDVENETLGGDPAPNEAKTLTINFRLGGHDLAAVFKEHEHVELP